ncbi:MAG: DUF479 domain-containing protein [Cyclobacteriaceae bacterium]|nr:DUF479 domain-containing protein [Cytophagales bacterium]MBX2901100.1 DUF479 domain-containing protein [Cyclobacteriaceae bacterium]
MNFLAHLYLSGNHPEIQVGNFMGDFVRGRNLAARYPYHIALGVALHREIDEFTDSHPVVRESKIRLRPKYRHYAPVIVDMFYDHFLAANWKAHHAQPLQDYAQHAYTTLTEYTHLLPEGVKALLPYMVNGNWLLNYAKPEGIHRALSGMARRTPYDSKMDEAVEALTLHYTEFANEFDLFFPDLKQMAEQFIKEHPESSEL